MPKQAGRKVAIVHDWLYGGGAERVVLELHQMFPEAPIYTSYCSDEWRAKLDNKVVTGYLQHWPFNTLRKFIPFLRIKWFEGLDLSDYDLVVSSSGNGEAKGVKAGSQFKASQTHVCYCHTPVHFYWRHYEQYLATPGFGALDPIVRLSLKLLVGPLRRWDLKASKRPDYYIANSNHIRHDIKKFYGRDATVIFPPVDVERFSAAAAKKTERQGFVTVGRQVPQKFTRVIVEACSQFDIPLTVIGNGPEHSRLAVLAGPTVTFITGPEASNQLITDAVASAEAFIFAAFDDFGITPIEALAAGTPVIAFKAGGALDYIEPGINGEFFTEQTAESLAKVLEKFDGSIYNHQAVARSASRFSSQNFRQAVSKYLASL